MDDTIYLRSLKRTAFSEKTSSLNTTASATLPGSPGRGSVGPEKLGGLPAARIQIVRDDPSGGKYLPILPHIRSARGLQMSGRKSYALYRESHMRCIVSASARQGPGEERKADRRRIRDTTPCTKPLAGTYGDWFPVCSEIRGREVCVGPPVRRQFVRGALRFGWLRGRSGLVGRLE
jgi:hypothetical protein